MAILSAQNGEVVLKDLNSFYALNMYNVWIYFNRIFIVLTMVHLMWVLVHPKVVAAPCIYPFIGHKCASWPTFHFECGWVLLSLFSYLIWTITIVIHLPCMFHCLILHYLWHCSQSWSSFKLYWCLQRRAHATIGI